METAMPDAPVLSLAATSPFELRVHLGDAVPEQSVREALSSGDMGFLHSYTTGSTVDGPGVRVVAWTTGCMWRCQYCHNPDTWHKRNGHPVTVSRAMTQIGKYAKVLKITKGGITLSGGEPMVQRPFMARIFRRCKELGLHTCLDTAGRLGEKMTDREIMDVDLHLLDIKSGDPALYQKVTNQPLQPTLDYARRLSDLGRPMWVRFVLVPELTDNFDDIHQIADFAAGLGNVERVEVLPFHQMGRFKWKNLGIRYNLEDTQPPSAEVVDRAVSVFRSAGLDAC
jgi:pyruvate formate lyase activating enzyme